MASSMPWHGDEVAARAEDGIQAALGDAATDIEVEAATVVPVATGALQDSIGHEVGDRKAIVYAGMPYAVHVEYGTSRMAARPFLRPYFLSLAWLQHFRGLLHR